jgi:hypothetical protein
MQGEKSKLCPYCEGDIPMAMSDCPYCGADLTCSKKEEMIERFAPPFKELKAEINVNDPFEKERNKLFEETTKIDQTKKMSGKKLLATILLLTLGGELFGLALCILMFATKGELILAWSVKNVWILFLIAFPCLLLGTFLYRREIASGSSIE